VCKVYGRKPCETYQTCIKCYKDFNICKCYIKKELKDHFEYKKILTSTFKDLVSTKPANRIPRQFREMSIRRQNYYHVLNNPGIYSRIDEVDTYNPAEWYIYNSGNGNIVFCIKSCSDSPIWSWQPMNNSSFNIY
jgi:hypothetical protein